MLSGDHITSTRCTDIERQVFSGVTSGDSLGFGLLQDQADVYVEEESSRDV